MKNHLPLKLRLFIPVIYIAFLVIVCRTITGVWIPPSGGKSLWFISSIALWFFTQLSVPFFIKPRDAVARSAAAAFQLAVVDLAPVISAARELSIFRWLAVGLASLTAIVGSVAILLHRTEQVATPKQRDWSRVTYRFAERFGQGAVIFTPAVLISIFGFYQDAPMQQLALLFVWSLLIFIRPVELTLHTVRDFRKTKSAEPTSERAGEILRIDWPGIVRVKLKSPDNWNRDHIHAACLANSKHVEVLPLFLQTQGAELVGTGLCVDELAEKLKTANPGDVFPSPDGRTKNAVIRSLSGSDKDHELIGFVIENSTISQIRFEVASDMRLREGALVMVLQMDDGGPAPIYYQIVYATTEEESFSRNPLGRHVASAAQVGRFDRDRGFVKYGWLPAMNTPVFLLDENTELPLTLSDDEFRIGTVPYSKIMVGANLNDLTEYHSAILGVTGTGKTELAFDVIRFALQRGFKVFCVDFTEEYEPRLQDSHPQLIDLEEADINELNAKIFAVETADFGGGPAKAELQQTIDNLRPKIQDQVKAFLEPEAASLGILRLKEIANTRATLRLTEMYLSSIFEWAREYRQARRILIVLEEAHTIVPEMNLYGRYDKSETESVLGRTAQIALQGRKYGVGLLLVSQRTALVSKTLLSQCNTVLCFAMYDETGLKYLGNVFSTDHVSTIPNLKRFQAIALGKGIKSERPIIFQIPEDPEKKRASEELRRAWVPPAGPAVEQVEAPVEVAVVDLEDDHDVPF